MSGLWVFVCGPSGAGKDSLIRWAQTHTAQTMLAERIVFSRRMITRPAHPESDHEPLDRQDFNMLLREGEMAWHWQAHGVHYGVPSRYAAEVAAGKVVVVNGSREHVLGVAADAPVRVVHVQAEAARLAERLALRGRDTVPDIAERMERNALLAAAMPCHCMISNDEDIAAAGQRFLDYLASCVRQAEDT
jgi:ribose 1,5-bisphosphokinase